MKKFGILSLAVLIGLIGLIGLASCGNGNEASKTGNTAESSSSKEALKTENTTERSSSKEALMAENTTESSSSKEAPKIVEVSGDYYESVPTDKDRVELYKVNERIWVHKTYMKINGADTPSNGLIAITSDGLFLVDTPWTNGQTNVLLKLAKDVFKQDITTAVITHAHADRIGGIDTLIKNDIEVRCTDLTAKEAEKNGFTKPDTIIGTETDFSVGDVDIETYYPGKGHSPDNITVWFPQYKVLFGGCLLKSLDAKDRGSVTDADIGQWSISIARLKDKYPKAEVVIPGHGQWDGPDIFKHTLELVS